MQLTRHDVFVNVVFVDVVFVDVVFVKWEAPEMDSSKGRDAPTPLPHSQVARAHTRQVPKNTKKTKMLAATYTTHEFLEGETLPLATAEAIRADLRTHGFAVVQLYDTCPDYEASMNQLAQALRPDGGSAHGGRGMGGITKVYGAACHPAAAAIRLDPRARAVHAGIYGLAPHEVMSGWDAVAILGTDATRSAPFKPHTDPKKHYFALTGGSLQAHVDICPGTTSYGAKTEAKMAEVHPVFPHCVQSQLVCRTVPRGGAALVVAPGAHAAPDSRHFDATSGRDFAVCTDEGYKHFHGQWRAVEAPQGCLILWLSRTPHGNKLADKDVDPQRRVVYISWQARALVPDAERAALKRKKMDAVYSGGSTDHWSTQVPKVHRGSHYSNGKGLTHVLYDRERAPTYDADLARRVEDAF